MSCVNKNKMHSEQNALLNVTSLGSVRKYCKENNKIKPNMKLIFSRFLSTCIAEHTHIQTLNKYFVGIL